MKKFLVLAICVFFISINAVFAEEFNSFNGIEFGTSYEDANKIMLEKKWQNKGVTNEDGYKVATYTEGVYAGLTVSKRESGRYGNIVELRFYNDEFCKATVKCIIFSEKTLNKKYNDKINNAMDNITNAIKLKYNLKVVEVENKLGNNDIPETKMIDVLNENYYTDYGKYVLANYWDSSATVVIDGVVHRNKLLVGYHRCLEFVDATRCNAKERKDIIDTTVETYTNATKITDEL